MKAYNFVVISLAILALAACSPTPESPRTKTTIPLPTSTSTLPSPTIESIQGRATPTEFRLPFNDKNVENKYCQAPHIPLAISETQGWSDDQIVEKLMALQLAYFNVPQAPD